MRRQGGERSIRYKFLKDISIILLVSTFVLSFIVGANESRLLRNSLTSKGQSLAASIAKRNEDALIISGNVQLDNVLCELITDEDVLYTIIQDNNGRILTTQFESINYKWPGLLSLLPGLAKEIDLPGIIAAIKAQAPVREVSVPIRLGSDVLGQVTIGMSEQQIGRQIVWTVLFVVGLNIMVALILGAVLFITSKKTILDPIIALGQVVSRFAKGDLAVRAEVKAGGEVGMLVDSFNQMADALNSTTVSKQYVDNIIKSMLDVLLVISADKKIVLANPAACRLLGYDQEELAGQSVDMVFQDGPVQCDLLTREIFAHGFAGGIRTEFRKKSGDKVLMLLSGSTIVQEGQVSGIVFAAMDITENEKLKEELLKFAKLESVGLLAGGIAHDFNNLLQGIFGCIYMAKLRTEKDGEVCKMLENAEHALALARNLTRQLLVFAKGGEPMKKTISVARVVRDSAALALSGSKVVCNFSGDERLWPVEADEGQISQVVQNLTINALDAMPTGGTLAIEVKNVVNDDGALPLLGKGRYVLIAVRDNGSGIAEQDIARIFDPYFTTKEKGSGLGLATSFTIVKKHGGIIRVESTPGAGSTFFVYLPASAQKLVETRQEEQRPMGGTGRILIMDDEALVRAITSRMLSNLGYEADAVGNGEEALASYAEAMQAGNPYAAVLLDLTIKGGMGGKETMAGLLQLDPGVHAVVASGYSDDPVMANFREYGFQEAMAKPYTLVELGNALGHVLPPGATTLGETGQGGTSAPVV